MQVLKQYWTKSESYGSSGYVNVERLSVELFHSSRDLPILIFCHNDAPRIVFSIGETGIFYQNCNNPGFARWHYVGRKEYSKNAMSLDARPHNVRMQ